MQTAKEEVMEILKGLPDNSTLEEIQYHFSHWSTALGIFKTARCPMNLR